MRDEVLFFFDLEVVPREAPVEEIERLGVGSAPKNYRDVDKIKAYELRKSEELYRAWSFDPMRCQVIVCSSSIGRLIHQKNGPPTFDPGVVCSLTIDEHDIIADLDRIAAGLLSEVRRTVRVIAHNVKGYDAPVLMAEAVRTGSLNLYRLLDFDKPWESRLWDTCEWWRTHCSTGRRSTAKLDAIAKYLGVESKTEGMDGSMVLDVYRNGGLEEIVKYCEQDVRVLSAVYRKILVAI